MYYFSLLACLVVFVSFAAALKSFDMGSALTLSLLIPAVLLAVCGVAWFAAKDSAAEAKRMSAQGQQ